MSVREQALDAHWKVEEAKGQERDEAERARLRRARDAMTRAARLLQDSALKQWFPDVEWEVYQTHTDEDVARSRGTQRRGLSVALFAIVCADRPGATDPEWAGVPCFGISDPGPREEIPDGGERMSPKVFYVHSRNDDGYTSWGGPEVRSVEELGAMIAAHEDHENKRLQAKYQQQCRCFRNGKNPMNGESMCSVDQTTMHAALLAAADSAHCEQDVAEAMARLRFKPGQDG